MPRKLDIFIASASDVKEERKATEDAINDLNSKVEHLFGVTIRPRKWEDVGPETARRGQTVQGVITEQRLAQSDWVVVILGLRVGQPDEDTGLTGLQQELEFALINRRRVVKQLLVYVKKQPQNVPTNQAQQVVGIQQTIDKLRTKVLYVEYENAKEFEQLIFWDLLKKFHQVETGMFRRNLLRKFFLFKNEEWGEPSVRICYPVIHKRKYDATHTHDWTVRLLPNLLYEHFEAIRILEGVLRECGVKDFEAVTVPSHELVRPSNRIWLCVPQNEYALQSLSDLGKDNKRVNFRFGLAGKYPRTLTWNINSSSPIKVISPLGKYIGRQRKVGGRLLKKGELSLWDPIYANIIARDYAVISRFMIREGAGTGYYQYFISGIRGLGTWGASAIFDACNEESFADCFDKLATMGAGYNDDVQRLFEVTYRNGIIKYVVDVTDEKQEYFNDRYLDSFIKKEILQSQ